MAEYIIELVTDRHETGVDLVVLSNTDNLESGGRFFKSEEAANVAYPYDPEKDKEHNPFATASTGRYFLSEVEPHRADIYVDHTYVDVTIGGNFGNLNILEDKELPYVGEEDTGGTTTPGGTTGTGGTTDPDEEVVAYDWKLNLQDPTRYPGNYEGNVVYDGGYVQDSVAAIDYVHGPAASELASTYQFGGSIYFAAQTGAISEKAKASDDKILIAARNFFVSTDATWIIQDGEVLIEQDASASAVRTKG